MKKKPKKKTIALSTILSMLSNPRRRYINAFPWDLKELTKLEDGGKWFTNWIYEIIGEK